VFAGFVTHFGWEIDYAVERGVQIAKIAKIEMIDEVDVADIEMRRIG
jgi:hypothetical protein